MARRKKTGSVVIKLHFDDSGAVRSIEGLDGRVTKVRRNAAGFRKTGTAAFAQIAVAVGGATLALNTMIRTLKTAYDFMEKSVMGTAKTQDDIAKMSRSLGVAVEELSSFRVAAKIGGAELEDFGTGLRMLARNAYDASHGTGEAKEAFKELGIEVVDQNGNLRSTKALLFDVADRFAGMTEGSVSQVVAQGDGLGELFVQAQRPGQGTRYLAHLQGVGHARAVVIPARSQEHLGLV